jgi:biopolymer transport protein ExbD
MKYLLEVCLIALAGMTTWVTAQTLGAPEMQKGISVELAVTNNATPMPDADQAGSLIVSITNGGSVYFGIDPISTAALADKIKDSRSKVYIKADARTRYANVVKVLEAVHTAGVQAPALLTAQPAKEKAGTRVPPSGLEVLVGPPLPSGSVSTLVQVLNSGQQPPILKVNNEVVPSPTLQSTLNQSFQNRSEKVVLLQVERTVPFADVAHVIDICRSTGARVVLATPGL